MRDYRLVTKDEHGQPLSFFRRNADNNASKAIDQLSGICRGILADGIVNDAEAKYFVDWVRKHSEFEPTWPFTEILSRIDKIFTDGLVQEEERLELKHVMEMICGDSGEKIPSTKESRSSALPLDDPQPSSLTFPGRNVSITGKFAYGNRKKVIEAVSLSGAVATDNAPSRNTHILIIGRFVSRDWYCHDYGRKIEKAVELRNSGTGILIVSEQHWRTFIDVP
jgi:hypothetical protein